MGPKPGAAHGRHPPHQRHWRPYRRPRRDQGACACSQARSRTGSGRGGLTLSTSATRVLVRSTRSSPRTIRTPMAWCALGQLPSATRNGLLTRLSCERVGDIGAHWGAQGRFQVLGGLANGCFLVAVSLLIWLEGIERLISPVGALFPPKLLRVSMVLTAPRRRLKPGHRHARHAVCHLRRLCRLCVEPVWPLALPWYVRHLDASTATGPASSYALIRMSRSRRPWPLAWRSWRPRRPRIVTRPRQAREPQAVANRFVLAMRASPHLARSHLRSECVDQMRSRSWRHPVAAEVRPLRPTRPPGRYSAAATTATRTTTCGPSFCMCSATFSAASGW